MLSAICHSGLFSVKNHSNSSTSNNKEVQIQSPEYSQQPEVVSQIGSTHLIFKKFKNTLKIKSRVWDWKMKAHQPAIPQNKSPGNKIVSSVFVSKPFLSNHLFPTVACPDKHPATCATRWFFWFHFSSEWCSAGLSTICQTSCGQHPLVVLCVVWHLQSLQAFYKWNRVVLAFIFWIQSVPVRKDSFSWKVE